MAGLLLCLLVAGAAIAAAETFYGRPFAYFSAGVFLTASLWLVWDIVDRESGARSWSAGADAETLTAGVLRKLKGHAVVHGLKFHGFDVDHVLVGPSGVTAVETKWTSRDLDISKGVTERRLTRNLQDATRGAAQIDLYLRRAAQLEGGVRPALILWGAGVRDIPGGQTTVGGVDVFVGRQAREWRATSFGQQVLDEWPRRAALEALTFQEQRQL